MELSKKVYSTFEVAKILNVFSNTVIHWMNTGKLKGYKTPGGHRRIPKNELLRFIRENNLVKYIESPEKKKKILIVEDDEDAMELYINILGEEKYTFKKAYSGFSAGVANSFKPDLVILDIMLPDLAGQQICEFIRKDSEISKTKIIAVSALSDEEIIKKMYELGVDDYITKPYSVSELRSKVEKLLAA
jgi:excisionase family DNA binding protein